MHRNRAHANPLRWPGGSPRLRHGMPRMATLLTSRRRVRVRLGSHQQARI
ncbi:hypothetical protein BZL30_4645 [Mycobacterium kansasii]|uniref:Uncharacterized protein n=1 Tax=Mycobacterium kansasii TaxID=1768 RepID=A0A1V3X4H4_MYCKA|nr:hypothetical protein BZL30_4645 [Mycobacterium kansasii]